MSPSPPRSPALCAATPAPSTAARPLTRPGAASHDADAPAVRLLNDILIHAAARNASDLHFERGAHDWRIRLRIDGVLHLADPVPSHLRDPLIARIKALAGLDIAERRLPQDGRLSLRLCADRSEDFRVSTLPTVHGEKVVLRRLDTLPALFDFGMLGYDAGQQAALYAALHAPHGMILVTGPTGSGKTLSLFGFLNAINDPSINICTVEDPVELRLPGITQVSVREKAGLDFASVLRAFLRQDPDVMMVGEIRDAATADIAVKAAQTGHRVLSTLHTNDASSAIIRLRDIGIASYKLAAALRLVTAQRLVRKLCPQCREPDPLAIAQCAVMGSAAMAAFSPAPPPGVRPMPARSRPACATTVHDPAGGDLPPAWRAVGCDACHGIGYRGRMAIHEVMPISARMRELIVGDASVVALSAQARAECIPTLQDAALAAVRAGRTSLAEAFGATGSDA
ncbi:GspE/PulE family protein [Robbsia sp. Bb-Pol-6]|uniref:GspE/PulE family protein n=1 Tax=Robbsia betulipollinis TaxID=2981849 RepID=A0ABT3ZRM4_9BURK|nr:GspE/PulE family protein [Robbsia betulipollinis]MCY0388922.1 GspE/PulE family protein [Robbsia betulipollinis]